MYNGKNNKRGKVARFLDPRAPTIAPPTTYVPTRTAQKPAGYAQIEAASQFNQDTPEFIAFVKDVVNMPVEMAPAVSEAISQQKWKIAPNPLAVIRTAAHQAAKRFSMGAN
jgi:hypothetical protein